MNNEKSSERNHVSTESGCSSYRYRKRISNENIPWIERQDLVISQKKKTKKKDIINVEGGIIGFSQQFKGKNLKPEEKKQQNLDKFRENRNQIRGARSTSNSNNCSKSQSEENNSSVRSSLVSISVSSSMRRSISKQIWSKDGKSNKEGGGKLSSSVSLFSGLSSARNTKGEKGSYDNQKIAQNKLLEDKRRIELQLKLVRVKIQDFSRKCKPKSVVDWKKMQKTQLKQKIQEKICLMNEGMRIQANTLKVLDEFGLESNQIISEYMGVKETLQTTYEKYEICVSPYEDKVKPDILQRETLKKGITDQRLSLSKQLTLNEEVKEDNSQIEKQICSLKDKLNYLKGKKEAIDASNALIAQENQKLTESSRIQKEQLNAISKHHLEIDSRSLWLKKEIHLKKSGFFAINIICKSVPNFKQEKVQSHEREEEQILRENGKYGVNLPKQIEERTTIPQGKKSQKQLEIVKSINCRETKISQNCHFECELECIRENKYELLRSITDFEYFTLHQVYVFHLTDFSTPDFLELFQQFSSFFSTSKQVFCQANIYDKEGNHSSKHEISLDKVMTFFSDLKIKKTFFNPSSCNNPLLIIHLQVINQQFYLGKQFDILFAVLNESGHSAASLQHFKCALSNKPFSSPSFLVPVMRDLPIQQCPTPCSFQSLDLALPSSPSRSRDNQLEQQKQPLRKVMYNEIEHLIHKNTKNINFFTLDTPKTAIQKSQNQINSTSKRPQQRRSHTQDNKTPPRMSKNANSLLQFTPIKDNLNNKTAFQYLEHFFRKSHRLYSLSFVSNNPSNSQ